MFPQKILTFHTVGRKIPIENSSVSLGFGLHDPKSKNEPNLNFISQIYTLEK
jgi:hypothetical protein